MVECDEQNDPDLFYAVPWSYGTLGFLTSVTIRIMPVKRFIRIDYKPIQSLDEMTRAFEAASRNEDGNDFVECLMFDKERSVLMTGNMVDSCEPGKLNEIGRWFKPWFFKHVEGFLDSSTSTDHVEYIPMKDYYHRHSRSIFWEIQDIIPFGNNIVFRYLFGWLIPPKVSLLKLTQGKTLKRLYEENHMIQDMLVPIDNLKESVETFDNLVQIYPVWLCPFKLPNNPGMLRVPQEKLFVDVGVYGVPKRPGFDSQKTTRAVEEFVRKVGGFQMMYADSYMTKKEFREMFDHTLYDEMREKYNCHKAFPDIYDKVNKKARVGH